MRSVRPALLVALAVALSTLGVAPATASKPALATPQLTSAVAVDTRTATLSWTPVKGADHYVLEWAPGMSLYTSATTATVTDLYPGDAVVFTVRAETRRNAPSGTSDPVSVSLAPEGPGRTSGYALFPDTVKVWWGSGIGCSTYELATLTVEGGYAALPPTPYNGDPTTWLVGQAPGTTEAYAVRCGSSSGTWSTWSAPTEVTTPEA